MDADRRCLSHRVSRRVQRPWVVALLFAAAPWTPSARAQSAPAPLNAKSPAACLQGANDWLNKAAAELRAAKKLDNTNYAPLRAQSQALALACSKQFSVDNVAVTDLAALGQLYRFVDDTASARRTVERGLSAPGMPLRERGMAYLDAMSMANRAANAFAGRVAAAEEYANKIDAFPDSLSDLKLRAHQTMLGQYEYADNDEGIRYHATLLLEHGRRLKSVSAIGQAYESLARAAADYLHPDSALLIIAQGERELAAAPQSARSLADLKSRYALVGTRATPIVGDHWINAPDQPGAVQVGNGKITLVQFTAHWCAPCRNSYPGMLQLAKSFGDAYETIFVTDLYGYFGSTKMGPAEEIEADRKYYAEKHELPFRVAIAKSYSPEFTPEQRAATNDGRYRVGGIPQIVIIDKKGIIRQIVVGWDHGNTERFKEFIEKLKAE